MTVKDMTVILRDAPSGEWIALSKDQKKIVGSGKTVEEALKVARTNGENQAFVTKITPASSLIL